MTLPIQQIRYLAGGTLTFDPPELYRPSAYTYTLYKPDGTTAINDTGRTATLDSANTTLTAAASADATTITLTSAANVVVGRWYRMTAATDGESEWVRVVGRNTSTGAVELAEPLLQDYAIGDAFWSNRLTMAVDAADAPTGYLGQGYECRIAYTMNGVALVASVYYDVVRQPWPEVLLRPDEFKRLVGSMSASGLERLSAPGLQFIDEIENATELVRLDIVGRGMRPDLFRSFESFKRPIAMAVVLEWARMGVNIPHAFTDQPEIWHQQCETNYGQALTLALQGSKTYDETDDGAVSASEREADKAVRYIIL